MGECAIQFQLSVTVSLLGQRPTQKVDYQLALIFTFYLDLIPYCASLHEIEYRMIDFCLLRGGNVFSANSNVNGCITYQHPRREFQRLMEHLEPQSLLESFSSLSVFEEGPMNPR